MMSDDGKKFIEPYSDVVAFTALIKSNYTDAGEGPGFSRIPHHKARMYGDDVSVTIAKTVKKEDAIMALQRIIEWIETEGIPGELSAEAVAARTELDEIFPPERAQVLTFRPREGANESNLS